MSRAELIPRLQAYIYQLLHVHGTQKQLSAINRYHSRNSGLVLIMPAVYTCSFI